MTEVSGVLNARRSVTSLVHNNYSPMFFVTDTGVPVLLICIHTHHYLKVNARFGQSHINSECR